MTTKKLVSSVALGVLMTLFSIPGSLIAVTLGVPGAGALINGFLLPLFFLFALLLIQNFGTATIVGVVYGSLLLPTPIGGPPGFLAKTVLWFVAGLFTDIFWGLFPKKGNLAVLVTSSLASLVALFLFVQFLVLFQIPGGDKFVELVKKPVVVAVIALWGTLGGFTGSYIYKRMQNTTVAERIQGGDL